MDDRPVFCLISVKTCPACIALRRNWADIQKQISSSGLVRIVDIDLPSFQDKIDTTKYPEELSRLTIWAPSILLIEGKSWNNNLPGSRGTISSLRYRVFNGMVDAKTNRSKLLPDGQMKAPTIENIMEWIKLDTFRSSSAMPTIAPLIKDSARANTIMVPTVACRARIRAKNM